MSMMIEQGWNEAELLGAVVHNRGRTRVKVTGISINVDRGGFEVGIHSGFVGPETLPQWVEPGESVTWWVDAREARALLSAVRSSGSSATSAGMSVELGTGKKLSTPTRVRLAR